MKHEWLRVPPTWLRNVDDPHMCIICGVIRNPLNTDNECNGETKMRGFEAEMKEER